MDDGRLDALGQTIVSALAGAADFPLQKQDAVHQRLGGGRATGDINIHRHDAVAAPHHGIGIMIIAAAIGAAAH